MASGGVKTEIEDAPAAQYYRSAVWRHVGFGVTYEAGKKVVDKSTTVCKHCSTRAICAAGSTSNMLTHMKRHHPAKEHENMSKAVLNSAVYMLVLVYAALKFQVAN